jgi:glycerol-3-phosphate cytidylyltransferase
VIVLTIGSFDMLHVGHLELLRACRQYAGPDGRVVVGLNRDIFIERYKGRNPVQGYANRAEMLRTCRLVDLVVCNIGDYSSRECIDVVNPDLLVIGSDWAEKDYLGQLGIDQAWLDERHLTIRYIPRTRGVSSSALREAVA